MDVQELTRGENLFYNDLQVRAMPGVHDATLAALKRFVPTNQKMLEIGSGAGALTSRLHDYGYNVTASGIDANDYRYSEVPFTILDILQPVEPTMRNAFDVIVATEVIEHVENIFLFFRNASKILSPGGTLFITTPNATSLFSRLMFLRSGRIAFCNEELMNSWGHIQVIPEWLLCKAAHDAGLNCLQSLGVGTPRFDLSPFWHKWIYNLTLIFKFFFKNDFENNLRGSNLLMVLRKTERQ